ncbi:MAG TPA: DUF5956 family protein [Micromonosporaceae bacterium]|nr:DUF5956 family protein [Micromonosporaceae bacterium]
MVVVDWGLDQPAHGSSVADGPRVPETADRLPEVAALAGQGWQLSPDAPALAFLPAVWPRTARTWVRDRATRYETRWSDSGPAQTVPWPDGLYEEMDAETDALLAEAGVPGRPPGRLWLFRPPPRFATIDETVDHIARLGEPLGVDVSCDARFVEHAAREVARLFA